MSTSESRDPTAEAHTPPDPKGRVLRLSVGNSHGTHTVPVLGVSAPVVAIGPVEARVAAVARAQHGVLTRRQLQAIGLDDSAIARRVARGQLQRIHTGVYRIAGPVVPLVREAAALLACGEGALLSHTTAATLWELPVRPAETVHVLLAGRQTGRPAGVTVHRTRTLSPKDVRHRHGLPLTSPARTLLDLADILTARPLERALDEALAKRLVRHTQLKEVLARAHGRHGAGALGALLDPKRPTTRTRSGPEERFLALVRQARLPEPETNAPFLDLGFDVDVLWREQRLAVEIDSFDYHSTRRKFQRDRAKGAAIVRAGFTLLRPTPEQIDGDGLALIATVAETLARAA